MLDANGPKKRSAEGTHLTRFCASRIISAVGIAVAIAGSERKMRHSLVFSLLILSLLPAAAAERPAAVSDSETEIDVTFWKSVEGRQDRNVRWAYLRRFPNGVFAELARAGQARLQATWIQILPGPEPAPQPQVQKPH